ncbi:MAG: triple tyrosine motif-containing protein [Bacteroidetes bacterium]|nr:triple tyrosine motif-containing protein [Bacteroidota bacterium]
MQCFIVRGQPAIGSVEVSAYTRSVYAAGNQNWAITNDANGRLYVANNEGLLTYNGTNWHLYPVPNKTILRCISFGRDGKLYAGAQDELGYYAPDEAGQLVYTSLKNLLPEGEKTFADIWDIEVTDKGVFFRAIDRLFRLSENKLSVVKSSSSWLSLSTCNGKALAQEKDRGLFIFEGENWRPLFAPSLLPPGFIVTDVFSYSKDSCVVSTSNNGLFWLTNNTLTPFRLTNNTETHFLSLAALDKTSFLAGSYSNGLYKISLQGNVLEIYSDKNGLPNNTVRCIKTVNGSNVWIGLDNGIATMNCTDAIKHINPPSFQNGSGYAVHALNGDLYFALSTGLEWLRIQPDSDLSRMNVSPQTIIGGLTWHITSVNDQLLMGRDDGFWKVIDHRAELISAASGYWAFQPTGDTAKSGIAAGNYSGLQLFQQVAGRLTDAGGIPGFTESSRYLVKDGNYIWVSHPYRGVFRINLTDKTYKKYGVAEGLPASLDNHVFKLRNRVVFATPSGVYEYDANSNRIIPSTVFTPLFGKTPLRYLKEDGNGNIWFVQDKMVGVADFTKEKPVLQYIPELRNRILSGFENIYPYNNSNVFVGSESGFYFVNYDKYRQQIQELHTYITQVQVIGKNDNVLYGGYGFGQQASHHAAIPYKKNSIHFAFASSLFARQPAAEFSCYLEGFDETWSNWSSQYERDYTNLPEGDYIFHVKSRNSPANESTDCTFAFHIAAPWYRTWWAYAVYTLFFGMIMLGLYKFQDRQWHKKQEARRKADQQQFEDEQRQLTFLHNLEIEKAEKELIKLKNENLEAEIEHKNSELASTAMNLVQKKEFLLRITGELNKLCKPGKDTVEISELKKIIKSLGSEEKLDNEWNQFSIHFDNVHSNFLVHLKNAFPALSAHELKLCAYLRMNLSSKEIAQLMSISVRGVEINRYRLRKKLQVPPKEDLFEFLLAAEAKGRPEQSGE